MLRKLIIAFLLIRVVDGLMCYFCADSSSQDGRNQCQTWHKTMKYYRKKFEQTGSFKPDKYVKNCSSYGNSDRPRYCMIAYVEESGNKRTFIRDCSDGTSFFTEDIDKNFDGKNLNPDNQTNCQTSLQGGFVACITLCGEQREGSGDFCNGPVLISSARLLVPTCLTFIVLSIIDFF